MSNLLRKEEYLASSETDREEARILSLISALRDRANAKKISSKTSLDPRLSEEQKRTQIAHRLFLLKSLNRPKKKALPLFIKGSSTRTSFKNVSFDIVKDLPKTRKNKFFVKDGNPLIVRVNQPEFSVGPLAAKKTMRVLPKLIPAHKLLKMEKKKQFFKHAAWQSGNILDPVTGKISFSEGRVHSNIKSKDVIQKL